MIHYCTKYNYVDPHQKIMFSIIIVECFKFFPLCRLFFILKKCMCLLEPNDYYPYSMPMKPTIKTNLKIMNRVVT